MLGTVVALFTRSSRMDTKLKFHGRQELEAGKHIGHGRKDCCDKLGVADLRTTSADTPEFCDPPLYQAQKVEASGRRSCASDVFPLCRVFLEMVSFELTEERNTLGRLRGLLVKIEAGNQHICVLNPDEIVR